MWWRELNRIAKQHADRRLRALGYEKRGGLLAYSWEMQRRGVWHLHIVLGMQTAPEREWARTYVETLRSIGPSKGFGFVDAKPLETPREARRVAGYLSKYLAKWRPSLAAANSQHCRGAPHACEYERGNGVLEVTLLV
jgi:hypothetical protein